MTKFVWTNPRFSRKASPAKVGRELERIRVQNKGTLTPKHIVEAARARTSPLHALFTWDNTLAAERFREFEARRVISGLRVVIQDAKGPKVLRVYVHAQQTATTEAGFVSIAALDEGDARVQKIIDKAQQDLLAWVSRYQELRARLPGVFAAVEEALGHFD